MHVMCVIMMSVTCVMCDACSRTDEVMRSLEANLTYEYSSSATSDEEEEGVRGAEGGPGKGGKGGDARGAVAVVVDGAAAEDGVVVLVGGSLGFGVVFFRGVGWRRGARWVAVGVLGWWGGGL